VEAYDETFTVEGQAQGQTPGQVTLIDWTLTPGQDIAEAFEQSRRNLFELHRLHNPGFLRCRLLRYLGAPGRYLVVVASTGRETMLQAFRHPEIQRYVQDHGIARYAPAAPVVEVFEPVRVAVPA